MSENLIGQIIIGVITIISSYSLINWRVKVLEKKVDQHNQYSDRIANIETDIAVIKTDIGYIKNNVSKQEKGDH